MGKVILTKKQKELIERLGVFMESEGLSPAPSRIMGLLLVSDKLELTFEDIYETLKISKSAASNAINMLLRTHRVEYMTKSGERKRYFRTRFDQWEKMFSERTQGLYSMIPLLKEIHQQRPKTSREFNAHLKDFIAFIEFLHGEIPLLYKKWKERKI